MKYLFNRKKPNVNHDQDAPRVITSNASKRFNASRYPKLPLIVIALLMASVGTYFILNSFAATATCSTVTYPGLSSGTTIVYTFDKMYPCGQFANGDWWVAPNAGDSGVRVTSITPNANGGRNGWEVNPTSRGVQALDSRIAAGRISGADYSASKMPALPYTATANQSLVKAVSGNLSESYCRPCLSTAAVLTVLGGIPENDGVDFFRPPYVGTDKPLYRVSSLQTQLLPNLAPVSNMPTLTAVYERFKKVQLDHRDSAGSVGTRPTENYGNDPNNYYGPNVSKTLGDGALRLMINDPLSMSDPNNPRRKALVAYTQAGIEHYHFILNGQRWGAGDGEQPGMKMPVAFAAVMLNNQGMKDTVRNIDMYDEEIITVGKDNRALFGESVGTAISGEYSEESYWDVITIGSGNRTLADPYGYIDGGQEPGGVYQDCCTSVTFKGTVLAMKFMPQIYAAWPNEALAKYTERWVDFGAWSQPDRCAPPNQGGGPVARSSSQPPQCKLDPDWDAAANGCRTGGICGRFPSQHGANKDGGQGTRYSDFQKAMWVAYWNSVPSPWESPTTPPPPPAPDTTPPTVALTGPAAGATVSGTSVTVSATASDNTGVSGVQFKLDGANLGAEDTTAPYTTSWNTTTVSNGNHTLTAIARDAASNSTASTAVTVNVSNTTTPADTTPPTVPTSVRTTAVTATSVSLAWTASTDNVGVTKYNILRGSQVIGSTTSTSYVDPTNNTAGNAGPVASTNYQYTVQAADAAGNTANSAALSVTTSAPPADTTPPSAVTLVSTTVTATQVMLNWDSSSDSESGIKGYDVYRNGVKLNSTQLSNTTFNLTDATVSASTSYTYLVKAINNANLSSDSNSLPVTTPAASTTSCTLNASPTNFASVFNGAGANAVICLGAGNYATFAGAAKTGVVTIKSASGVASSVTMSISFNQVTNITIDGVTITYGEIMGTQTKNITIKNSDFPSQLILWADTLTNANVTLDSNVHRDFDANSLGTPWREGRIFIPYGNSQPNGITIKNSKFLRGNSDGIQGEGNGVQILNNEFSGIVQVDGFEGVHADAIQLLGSDNMVIRGNYFHDNEIAIGAYDGSSNTTVTDNVIIQSSDRYAMHFCGGTNVLATHNTTNRVIAIHDCKSVASSGAIRDNIAQGQAVNGGVTQTNNVVFNQARFTGCSTTGCTPTTWAGFLLAAGSPGKGTATDGGDVGTKYYGPTTPAPGPKVGDLDGDNLVTGHDLSLLLSKFNTTYAPYDIDGAPPITGHDLSLLLANFGK